MRIKDNIPWLCTVNFGKLYYMLHVNVNPINVEGNMCTKSSSYVLEQMSCNMGYYYLCRTISYFYVIQDCKAEVTMIELKHHLVLGVSEQQI